MKTYFKLVIILFFGCINSYAQDNYLLKDIPENLIAKSNSVVRFSSLDINIEKIDKMVIKEKKVTTVMNKLGLNNLNLAEFYNQSTKVKTIEVQILNAYGKEIAKYKKKDFKENSVADGFSLVTDNRVLYLDYTPTVYPFTVVYFSEIETSNTAFIPNWTPISEFYESVQKSEITINFQPDLGFKYKKNNFEGIDLKENSLETKIHFYVENLKAIPKEHFLPDIRKFLPYISFANNKFSLEGIQGNSESWENLGNWIYNALLKDTESIPEETLSKISTLVKDANTNIDKAKIVYKYLQEKSRYVSIQLGIGGWKPMQAKDVDRLGYGDCKALTNYTRSILKSLGIPSFYTVAFAGKEKLDISEDFVSLQGNHAFLSIPHEGKYIPLECTSKDMPFGFCGKFIDDRKVFIVKENGSEISKISNFIDDNNTISHNGKVTIDNNGNLSGIINIISEGFFYDDNYTLESLNDLDKTKFYNNRFSWLNNLKLNKTEFVNDKGKVRFHENVDFTIPNYFLGSSFKIFNINIFSRLENLPNSSSTRKNPFEVSRGFNEVSFYEIIIPKDLDIESLPDSKNITTKFGDYELSVSKLNDQTIKVIRKFSMNKNIYESNDYEDFLVFLEQVNKYDNSKMVLKQN